MRHRFHAICPYFAMFPESFPERWIGALTRPGDTVLDPFSGRGTTAFQAILMGRRAVANDINPVAFCITKAKVDPPEFAALNERIDELESIFKASQLEVAASVEGNIEFFHRAYASETLRQLVFLRKSLDWRNRSDDAMIGAITLGILHGESGRSNRYLSSQMPRTISTKPDYSVRWWKAHGVAPPSHDTFVRIRAEAEFRYGSSMPVGIATVVLGDMRDLHRQKPRFPGRIKCVVTSPPYLDTTSFEEDQWLRLWFLGGPTRPARGRISPDDRLADPTKYWAMISDFWTLLENVLDERADVVIRIGGRLLQSPDIIAKLEATSSVINRRIRLIHSETSLITRRQTNAFRPGSTGVKFEVDCHFRLD